MNRIYEEGRLVEVSAGRMTTPSRKSIWAFVLISAIWAVWVALKARCHWDIFPDTTIPVFFLSALLVMPYLYSMVAAVPFLNLLKQYGCYAPKETWIVAQGFLIMASIPLFVSQMTPIHIMTRSAVTAPFVIFLPFFLHALFSGRTSTVLKMSFYCHHFLLCLYLAVALYTAATGEWLGLLYYLPYLLTLSAAIIKNWQSPRGPEPRGIA